MPFAYAPHPFPEALGEGVQLATERLDDAALAGCRVAVIGGGQNVLGADFSARRAGAALR